MVPLSGFESEARALAESYGVRWLIPCLLVFPPLVLSYYADRDTCLSSILGTGSTGCETHNLAWGIPCRRQPMRNWISQGKVNNDSRTRIGPSMEHHSRQKILNRRKGLHPTHVNLNLDC
jgi:hypothetical protein